MEEKRNAVEAAFRNAWVSGLVPLHNFISLKSEEGEDLKRGLLVIRAGPFNLLVLDVVKQEGSDDFVLLDGMKTQPRVIFVDDLEKILIAKAVPVVTGATNHKCLGWKMEDYMDLKDWVADHSMLTIKAGMLIKLCSKLKVPQHSRLDHRHRVELYLRWMQRSEEFINEILAALPVKQKKSKNEDLSVKYCMVLGHLFKANVETVSRNIPLYPLPL